MTDLNQSTEQTPSTPGPESTGPSGGERVVDRQSGRDDYAAERQQEARDREPPRRSPRSKPERKAEGRDPAQERRSIRQELEAQFDQAKLDPDARRAEPGKATPAPQAETQDPLAGLPAQAKAMLEANPELKAAVAKRLADSAAGVAQLKSRYQEIEQAIAPHAEAIRAHGHTPAAAVGQLFSWFQALASNPKVAFPALLRSFNLSPEQVFGNQGQAGGGQAPEQQLAQWAAGKPDFQNVRTRMSEIANQYIAAGRANEIAGPHAGLNLDALYLMAGGGGSVTPVSDRFATPFIPPEVEQKLSALEQRLGAMTEEKTHEVLRLWAQGKPHFEKVRRAMAAVIQSGVVPLKNGRVDLDGAYEYCCRADPEINQMLFDERAKAEREANQKQANRARRAAVSLAPSAPGAAPSASVKKGPGKSVRESLQEAIREAAEG